MLSNFEKDSIREASNEAVISSLNQLKIHLKNNNWIGKQNRYRKNCIKKIEKDIENGTINDIQLRKYIAASAFLHSADSWSLLGKALDCHNKSDYNSARHLGYYSELRAALSILASEGIGIFNTQHFVIINPSQCRNFANTRSRKTHGTHVSTWLALEYWSNLNRSSELVSKIIKPGNIPLEEWINYFELGNNYQVGKKWFRSWGFDLKQMSKDRDARNVSSYRPSEYTSTELLDVDESLAFLKEFWKFCEPKAYSRFDNVDFHLLRKSLVDTYEIMTGKEYKKNTIDFNSRIDQLLKKMGMTDPLKQLYYDFLTYSSEKKENIIIEEASGKLPIYHSRHHIQVISRALLLQRVSTGICSKLLNDVNFDIGNLHFWLEYQGLKNGLWNGNSIFPDLLDLWKDIEDAITDVETWEKHNEGNNFSLKEIKNNLSNDILTLSECERINLWGLGD